ncbi:GNAT family N-acetyltransferase [Gemmobacter sp.]|uniref:GNAT family N-acetyltransferase n=1 Tax=Gemmobacter sp. TaxID=1898957 RepID=UPI0025C33247|nr:GNAT family N-acetyltransferase [Gemmobacter sp.]
MDRLSTGRLTARLAETAEDVGRAQALRHLCFHGRPGRDADAFDSRCDHVLLESQGQLLGCYRVLGLDAGGAGHSYSGQRYDLAGLTARRAPMLELGRFCLAPGQPDPDLMRLAWAMLARLVDRAGAALLFGCTSFPGADPARHAAALSLLAAHPAPPALAPGRRSPDILPLQDLPPADPRQARGQLPALLRSYLALGGWVSDHAVIDRQMDTLHVFTAVEIAAIPPARARALRLLAGD